MKNLLRSVIIIAASVLGCSAASAQYYEIANQLPGLIRPALTGGLNYKGYVDANYIKGLGDRNVDFLGVSTSQGFKYADWFFMGVGIGVDVVFSHTDEDYGDWGNVDAPGLEEHGTTSTGVMIPLFTDFRFNIGKTTSASFFIDLKVGCSFLVGRDYLSVDNGYLTSQQYFLLRPTLGVRIPVNKEKPSRAFNVGITYQLLTSNYWSRWNQNVTLNGLGANISYEW